MYKNPYTTKPEDVTTLLKKIPEMGLPEGKVDAGLLKSWGFTASSGNHLIGVLQKLGFLSEENEATSVWQSYAADEKRGLVLASAVKQAYPEVFDMIFCPYLEADESLLEFFAKVDPKASQKDLWLILETFRKLNDLADFQDLLCAEGPADSAPPQNEVQVPDVKVNPNLQLNIQVHIDPNTPEEKIEAIFKNMRKYLIGKE